MNKSTEHTDAVVGSHTTELEQQSFNERVICGYLYVVSRFGYPPMVEDTLFHISEMERMGFKSVELEANRPSQMQYLYRARKSIKKELDRKGMKVPYLCSILPGLTSLDSSEREKNLGAFEQACDTAEVFGSKGIFDNGPLPPYQFPGEIPIVRHFSEQVLMAGSLPADFNWNRYWDTLVGTYREVCDLAAARNLTVQIHPALGVLAATTEGFLAFREAVGRDNLRFTLDTANQYLTRDNLTLSLIRLKESIDYIHVSDNQGQRMEHLLPGQGGIHWPGFFDVLSQIGFTGDIAVDIGGEEIEIENIAEVYKIAASWIERALRLKES